MKFKGNFDAGANPQNSFKVGRCLFFSCRKSIVPVAPFCHSGLDQSLPRSTVRPYFVIPAKAEPALDSIRPFSVIPAKAGIHVHRDETAEALPEGSTYLLRLFRCSTGAAVVLSSRPDHDSRINCSSSSAVIFPLMSAPSSRLSARPRLVRCRATIFSSMVCRAMRR